MAPDVVRPRQRTLSGNERSVCASPSSRKHRSLSLKRSARRSAHLVAAGGFPLVLSLVIAVTGIGTGCARKPPPATRPSVPVVVSKVRRADVPYTITANGQVTPVELAAVTPQVDGLITRVAFREGQDVTQGQPLFQIESAPYRAAYQQALATLARDSAAAENTRRQVVRYEALERKDYVTKEQVDQIRTGAATAEATVKADRAAVATARFNLDKTTIRAPIAGRTGSLLVRTGNVVRAAQATPLVTINQIRPIYVRFAVPGTELPLIQRYAARGGLPVTAAASAPPSGDGTDTSASLGAMSGPPQSSDVPTTQQFDPASGARGSLFFIDNSVDTATGTVMLKATFPNQPATLWAGEFVSTALLLFTERNALVVPATAVLTGQQGTYVYVIDSTRMARQRPVTVERTAGEVAVIASGLEDGEQVVTDGQSRLTPGAKVTITRGEARSGARKSAAGSSAPYGSSNATTPAPAAPATAAPVPASPVPAAPAPSTRPGGRP